MPRQVLILQLAVLLGLQAVLIVVLWNIGVPRWVVWMTVAAMAACLPLVVMAAVIAPRIQNSQRVMAAQERPWIGALFMIGLAIVMWLGTAMITAQTGGSYLVRLIASSQHMAVFLGFALIGYGCRREGKGRYCRKCEYEMSPEIEAEAGLDRCPECGSAWRGTFGTVRGRRRARWRWIAAGIGAAGLLMAWPFVSLRNPGLRRAPLAIMPTTSLMAEAAAGISSSAEDAMIVLQRRGLTPAQEEWLAVLLLDRMAEKDYIPQAPRDWLTVMESKGKLSPELSRRFLEEHPYPALIPGDRRRLGLPPGPTSAGP